MTRNIVPECYVDTKVAEILGKAKKYNHQHGSGDVARELQTKLINLPALGIIDEDRNKGIKAKYLLEFKALDEQDNLILKKHPNRLHYLIFVCPEIEKWLLQNADMANLNPLDYGLKAGLDGLKKATKIQDIDKHLGFYQFVKALLVKEAPGIITLRNWITGFTENTLLT